MATALLRPGGVSVIFGYFESADGVVGNGGDLYSLRRASGGSEALGPSDPGS